MPYTNICHVASELVVVQEEELGGDKEWHKGRPGSLEDIPPPGNHLGQGSVPAGQGSQGLLVDISQLANILTQARGPILARISQLLATRFGGSGRLSGSGSVDVTEWVGCLEGMCRLENVSPAEIIGYVLEGNASRIYERMMVGDASQWAVVKAALLGEYALPRGEAHRRFIGRRLEADEPVDVYVDSLERLGGSSNHTFGGRIYMSTIKSTKTKYANSPAYYLVANDHTKPADVIMIMAYAMGNDRYVFKTLNNQKYHHGCMLFCNMALLCNKSKPMSKAKAMFNKRLTAFTLWCVLVTIETKDVVVNTSSGAIRGTLETWKNTKIEAFLGIPFGKPPIGNRRFSRPEAMSPWKGIYNATEFKPDCIQQYIPYFRSEKSEDCLYLNIWMPKTQHVKARPVIFYIFEGGFIVGTSQIAGSRFSALMDAVVVSVNYRLDAFGFLNMHIAEAPGNMGLLDQQLALEWIKRNIDKFGGDSDSITIMGFSAGGASVGYHLLSPNSRNLFKRAAMHSGSPNAVWSFNDAASADAKAMQLAEFSNCDKSDFYSNPKRLAQCLKQVPTKTLLESSVKVKRPLPQTFSFVPTLDNHFISDTPYNLLNQGNFKKTEVIIGSTKNEGGSLMQYGYFKEYFIEEFPTVEQLHKIPSQMYPDGEDSQLKDIFRMYYGEQDIKCRKNGTILASDLIGDTGFACPSLEFADAIDKFGGKAFYYHFTHRKIGSTFWDEVPHASDINYILGEVQESKDYTKAEKELSRRMVSQWVNFINTGDPSSESYTWPTYSNNKGMYYRIDASQPESLAGVRKKYCDFWKHFENLTEPLQKYKWNILKYKQSGKFSLQWYV
ncbi:Acetylcholinesterase [Nymphon striatum]|nr:Acetylcholinesterase [Nymphon striatum]